MKYIEGRKLYYHGHSIARDSDNMPSLRLRGVSAKITDKDIPVKVKKIRKLLGPEYRIVIEGDHISIEGDIGDHDLRKKIDKILAN